MREITKSEKRILLFLKKNKEFFLEKENEIINKYFKVKPIYLKKNFCYRILAKTTLDLFSLEKINCFDLRDLFLLFREDSKIERKKWEPKVILNELIGLLEVLDN